MFNRDIKNLYNWLKLFFYLFLITLFIFLWYFKVISIGLNETDNFIEGILFSILNGLIWGMYLNVCGFGLKTSKDFFKYFLLAFLLYFIISGFGYFGISITIRLDRTNIDEIKYLLYYDTIITNSYETILFFTYNLPLFVIIFFVSHILESEIRA